MALALTMKDVRKHTDAQQRKNAWAHKDSASRNSWEFHGPDGFYWYGSAANANDAKMSGWECWLRQSGFLTVDES